MVKSKSSVARKAILSLAASATVLAASAPAFAGGGYYRGSVSYYSGHGGYYYGGHGYKRHRHYGRHHRRGGGDAAAIALGVIGGAIILNEIAEDRARAREDAYYEARYASRYNRPVYSDPIIYPEDDYYEDDGYYEDAPYGDELDERLDGGEARSDGGPGPIRLSAAEAYNACTVHARAALSERGYLLATPAQPETAEDMGRAWKITANVTTSDRRGGEWTRAMYCEATAGRVLMLELI